jgi:hypothetical protein
LFLFFVWFAVISALNLDIPRDCVCESVFVQVQYARQTEKTEAVNGSSVPKRNLSSSPQAGAVLIVCARVSCRVMLFRALQSSLFFNQKIKLYVDSTPRFDRKFTHPNE